MENSDILTKEKEKKIYTMSIPPTPQEPYLHPVRHGRIIRHFRKKGNAIHTLNSGGEVDFYLLLDPEDDLEELTHSNEDFGLDISDKEWLDLEIYYEDTALGVFHFDFYNPMDCQSLKHLLNKKQVNMYYINLESDEYVCAGFKTISLPRTLCYDISRRLEGRKPLLLPMFAENCLSDEYITADVLIKNAWGFYLDFTALLNRIGRIDEAEEIVTRHILHGMARMQRNRRQNIKSDRIILWVGRKIRVNSSDKPCEHYSIYLSGQLFTGSWSKDAAARIMEEAIAELPEFENLAWTSAVAEEAIPLAILTGGYIYRINLTDRFYALADMTFTEKYLTREEEGYESFYHKAQTSSQGGAIGPKVYDLLEKRREKYSQSGRKISYEELLNLIRRGDDKDLPWIFENLEQIKIKDMDEILVTLCEKFKKKIEPFLLPYLTNSRHHLKAVAILGLGMIESVEAVPPLIESVRGAKRDAAFAKYALALIGDPVMPFVLPLLTDKRAEIRIRGIDILALVGTPGAFKAIREMKKDRSSKVEQARMRAMQKKPV